jgi:hypothetical protein
LEVGFKAVESLRLLYQPLLQITEALGDTITLSGSEAYSGALTFYSSVKSAKKSKIAKAEVICDDLSARFPKGSGKAPANNA